MNTCRPGDGATAVANIYSGTPQTARYRIYRRAKTDAQRIEQVVLLLASATATGICCVRPEAIRPTALPAPKDVEFKVIYGWSL